MSPRTSEDLPSLAGRLRAIRASRGWTLKEMSAASGIPFSTLAKIERGRLSLTHDRLQALAERLAIPVAALFGEAPLFGQGAGLARRSLGDLADAPPIALPNGVAHILTPAILDVGMTPLLYRLDGASPGKVLSLPGECWLYVTAGAVLATTRHYEPARLDSGHHLYLDPGLAHGLAVAAGHDGAEVLAVCLASASAVSTALAGEEPRI